jgi:galactokinase
MWRKARADVDLSSGVSAIDRSPPAVSGLNRVMRHFHAPGRVNLIGDHIDYMGGTVLPMAIDRGTDLWARPRPDRLLVATSENFPEVGDVVAHVDATSPQPQWDWVNYLVAVVVALRHDGIEAPGMDVRVRGAIPNGAGLSSSASLELAMATAVNAIAGGGLDVVQLALAGQRAENEFIGVACGIMDQLSIAAGVAGHALAIDCGSLAVTPIAFPADIAVVVANTNQRRELSDSAYNDRRSKCEQAQTALRQPLVDVAPDEIPAAVAQLPEDLRAVARHVMTEQTRVAEFAEALRRDDRQAMGVLMRASHESLRDDFQVTGPALDAMAAAAWDAPGVIGARMTGAGFGGCTVNLVEQASVADFTARVGRRYTRETGLQATFYEVRSADGAGEVGR